MKIHEILVESQLQEGPILNKISSAVGKGVGTLAKGVGAVAGGVAGLGTAVKKGFQAGKATVGGAGDGEEPATTDNRNILQKVRDTMPGSKPTTGTVAGGTTQATQEPPAADTDGGTAQVPQQPPAQKKPTSAFGKLSAAAAGQSTDDAPAANPKADTAYAQAQKAIASLQPEQKKEIVTMLQADPKVKAAMDAKPKKPDPAAQARIDAAPQGYDGETGKPNAALAPGKTDPAAEPAAAEPAAGTTYDPAKAAADKLAKGQADQQAASQQMKATADANAAKSAEDAAIKKAAATARAKPGFSQSPEDKLAIKAAADRGIKEAKEREAKKKKKIAADRAKIMGVTSDSVIRTRPMMAEGFSLFRKR